MKKLVAVVVVSLVGAGFAYGANVALFDTTGEQRSIATDPPSLVDNVPVPTPTPEAEPVEEESPEQAPTARPRTFTRAAAPAAPAPTPTPEETRRPIRTPAGAETTFENGTVSRFSDECADAPNRTARRECEQELRDRELRQQCREIDDPDERRRCLERI